MRVYIIVVLLIVFTTCNAYYSKGKLLGSWTSIQIDKNYSIDGIKDRISFFPNDSFKIEIFHFDTLHETITGKYQYDDNSRVLTTENDSVKFTFDVLELSDDMLITKHRETHTIGKYKKL